MNTQDTRRVKMSENVIIVDGDYIDNVAFNLTINFERMLNRKIPTADFSQWIVNIALDGHIKRGDNETQVVILHDKSKRKLDHFMPSTYETELDKQAFKDASLGEFILNTIATGEDITNKSDVLLDFCNIVLSHKEMHRLLLIPNAEDADIVRRLRAMLKNVDEEEKHITLFAMEPLAGGNFKQQILGYSIMNAMGITADEIERKIK
ncbi:MULTISPECIES: DUF6621 family protein [Prevotella]|uniref:DUF6621 family protein n=1 Tax=Prevotella TaxID=838 RepID=UPI001031683B|nr:DUF6621 family protein [Prevotella brunnea]MDR0185496.1 hypothetical protein [Prevotella brunnea]